MFDESRACELVLLGWGLLTLCLCVGAGPTGGAIDVRKGGRGRLMVVSAGGGGRGMSFVSFKHPLSLTYSRTILFAFIKLFILFQINELVGILVNYMFFYAFLKKLHVPLNG